MHRQLTTFIVAGLTLVVLPFAANVVKTRRSGVDAICDEISKAISSASSVHWPGKPGCVHYPLIRIQLPGIVTKFNLTTHAQTEVWGGLITFTEDQLEKVNVATVKFSQQTTNPRAAVLPTYNFVLGGLGMSLLLFYNYPTPPEGLFNDYLAIPHFTKDVKTRSFLNLMKVAPSNATGGQRGIFHTVSLLQYTDKIMDAVLNETKFWGERLSWKTGHFISYDVEPFLLSIFSHAAEGSSAFPPSRAQGLLPLNIYYAWGAAFEDETFQNAARQSAAQLSQIVQAKGQDIADAALYGNYAIFDTPLERIYGANLPRLKELKAQYDPEGVMDLAGGWKF